MGTPGADPLQETPGDRFRGSLGGKPRWDPRGRTTFMERLRPLPGGPRRGPPGGDIIKGNLKGSP